VNYVFEQPHRPIEERIADLLGRLTLEEKISQMIYHSSAIPRLNIPEYNWWNECLHGVGRAGVATVFPQAIGMAASFNAPLIKETAEIIANEARAKHHEFARQGDRSIYKGLTFWSPNINIFRDPRWGRGQETYGEDPYLTSQLGIAFVEGLQGDHPEYLRVAACAKHFAVHSGPESLRHTFDAQVSPKDLFETFLPAFRALVTEGKVEAVMGAYNRTNGELCCASPTLLQKILRDEWGFSGHVVSDCGAIADFHLHHRVTSTPAESAALAVNNGCDLNCGKVFFALREAVEQGLISEETIDRSLARLLRTRFKLGMFDPPEKVPYAQIPYEIVACPEHRAHARKVARESMVLLKNANNLLPLSSELKAVAVIGPNAASQKVLLGNYFGTSTQLVTALEGIRNRVSPKTKVWYAEGCDLIAKEDSYWGNSPAAGFAEAIAAAQRSDAVIMCLGISPELEGEEGDAANSDGGGDRTRLGLPGVQEDLLKAIHATGKPIVLVLFSGSPLAVNWAQEHIPAIIQAWYPGEEGGSALADIIFGDYSPAGRLPVTFVKSVDDLPDITDYSMAGRTYRYMEKEPLYPFGYGLSYTEFAYANLKVPASAEVGQVIEVTVDVTNVGKRAGHEVAQLYVRALDAKVKTPFHSLQGFAKVYLQPGETANVKFSLAPRQLAVFCEDGSCRVEPGRYLLFAGGCAPDARSAALTGSTPLQGELKLVGEPLNLPV